LGLQK